MNTILQDSKPASKRTSAGADEASEAGAVMAVPRTSEISGNSDAEEKIPTYADDRSTLSSYLNQIGKTALLSREEELDLSLRARDGSDPARQHLIRANLRLVVKIAADHKHFGIPLMDLISEGNIGLIKAIERYDPDKGAKLSTYAAWWIRQSIRKTIAGHGKAIRLPLHQISQMSKIRNMAAALKTALGRDATDEEIARELEIPAHKVTHLKSVAATPASLDSPVREDDDTTLGELVGDDRAPTPYEELRYKSASGDIHDLVDRLTDRESEIIRERFGLGGEAPKTLEEISKNYNITRERVRQVQNVALKKLRFALEDKEKQRTRDEVRVERLEESRLEVISSFITEQMAKTQRDKG